jgi:hypothetical protein
MYNDSSIRVESEGDKEVILMLLDDIDRHLGEHLRMQSLRKIQRTLIVALEDWETR